METEAVVQQQEFVGPVAIAVEDLLAWLDCLSVLVDQVKVCLIFHFARFKPVEFLVGLLAVKTVQARMVSQLIVHLRGERRMIFSYLVDIKPLVFLQGPLRDRSEHLLILPPFLGCTDLLRLAV